MALDEKARTTLRELGAALNEAVSASDRVHELLQRLRDAGYDPYLCLDATVALDRKGRKASAPLPSIRRGRSTARRVEGDEAGFRIDVKDLRILQSLGIDPTRLVRRRSRPDAAVTLRSTVSRKS